MAFRYRGQVNLKPNPVPGAFDTLVCQGDESWATQPRHQRLLPGAVEVDPPNVPGKILSPVHLAAGDVQRRPHGASRQRADEGRLLGAVKVCPTDGPAKDLAKVHQVGPRLAHGSHE